MPEIQGVLEQDLSLGTESPVHWVSSWRMGSGFKFNLIHICLCWDCPWSLHQELRVILWLHVTMLAVVAGEFCCSVKTTLLLPAELAEQPGELADTGRLKGLVQGVHTVTNSELVAYPADSGTQDWAGPWEFISSFLLPKGGVTRLASNML